MLRFWAQDNEGEEIFSDTRAYGFNFRDRDGKEPAMVDAAWERGYERFIEPDKVNRETFSFPVPQGVRAVQLRATLTYIFFVTPPPEAKNRMQLGLIKKIQALPTQAEKDAVVNVEIPARMGAMNTLETANPPVVMATASLDLPLQP